MTTQARGRFITLEGGEGAGKTTLAAALAAELRQAGREVVVTREPGGTVGADQIRALLVSGEATRWSPLTETLLVMAARNDHVEKVIGPALSRGADVICDRFQDSTLAYQAGGRGLSHEKVLTIGRALAAPVPDLTLLLDLDPSAGLRRSRGAAKDEDRFERMDLAFHHRVRAAFLALAAEDPSRFRVLDAGLTQDALFRAALDCVRDLAV